MKKNNIERFIILDLAVILVVFAVFCIFWVPYDQSRLLRPIPANAVVISSHRNLVPRLDNLATNIFLKSFFDSDGKVLKIIQNHRSIFRVLASRLMITAYIPDFDQFTTRDAWPAARGTLSSNPVLVVSSWVGSWTPLLRWALWIHPPEDIVPLGNYNGYRLWGYKKPVQFCGITGYFSFSIDEGVFIGCLSRDRGGVVNLLRNYDGRKKSILDVPVGKALRETTALDQVLLKINLPNAARNKPVYAACSFDALENDHLAATVRFYPDVRIINDGAGRDSNPAEAEKVYALSPSIFVLLPSGMVEALLNGFISQSWKRVIKPFFSNPLSKNDACMIAVFTGDHGGKFGREPFRVTVPTFLLAIPGSRPEPVKKAVSELLDLINTKNRLGLILNSSLQPAGRFPIYAVESTSGALLKSLTVEDQPAYAFYNDWFLLASNSAGLRKLFLDIQSQLVPAGDGKKNLSYQADDLRKQAFIRIDPGEGGKALRLVLMVASVMLADSRDPSRQNTVVILKKVRSWLEAIGGLQNCAAWLETDNGKTVLRIEIGSGKNVK